MWSAASFGQRADGALSPLMPPAAATFSSYTSQLQLQTNTERAREMRTFVADAPAYNFAAGEVEAQRARQLWAQTARNPQARTATRPMAPPIAQAATFAIATPAPSLGALYDDMLARAQASRAKWQKDVAPSF